MFNLTFLIKTVGSFFLTLSLISCVTTQKNDIAKLKDTNYGIVLGIDLDKELYKQAISSELTPTTKELYKATLLKVGLIHFFEKQIGGNYKLEDELNIQEVNSLCIMGNFLKAYEKFKPKEIDQLEKYQWIDKKQQIWKSQLNEHYGSKTTEGDCRLPY